MLTTIYYRNVTTGETETVMEIKGRVTYRVFKIITQELSFLSSVGGDVHEALVFPCSLHVADTLMKLNLYGAADLRIRCQSYDQYHNMSQIRTRIYLPDKHNEVLRDFVLAE